MALLEGILYYPKFWGKMPSTCDQNFINKNNHDTLNNRINTSSMVDFKQENDAPQNIRYHKPPLRFPGASHAKNAERTGVCQAFV